MSSTKLFFAKAAAGGLLAWLVCGAMLAGIVVNALVLTVLWGWFVVPTFGLAPLSVPVAGGLVTICVLLRGEATPTRSEKPEKDDDELDPKELRRTFETIRLGLLRVVLRPIVLLGAGWLLKGMM